MHKAVVLSNENFGKDRTASLSKNQKGGQKRLNHRSYSEVQVKDRSEDVTPNLEIMRTKHLGLSHLVKLSFCRSTIPSNRSSSATLRFVYKLKY